MVNFIQTFITKVTISISISHSFLSWVAIYTLRPPMAYLSHSLYDMLGLAPSMNVLCWGRHDFQISFSNRDTSRNAWNRDYRSFVVDMGILSNNTKVLSQECLMTFCSLTKYIDNPPPAGLYTDPLPFFLLPTSTFYRLMRGSTRTFATDVPCWQGTLTPPDIWSRPIWDLYMFYLLRPILFPYLYFFRTIHFKHPSVLSQFCFLYGN